MKSPLVKEVLDKSSVLPLHINIPDCFILEFAFTKQTNKLENIQKILFNIKYFGNK